MNCMKCAREIPESYFAEWSQSGESRLGVFACPHCQARHLRRSTERPPDGKPVFEFRLWGHPASRSVPWTASPPQRHRRRPVGPGAP